MREDQIDRAERLATMRNDQRARAPTGPSSQGAIPSSQQVSNVRGTGGVPGGGTGWAREIPLSPPPGIQWVDAQLIADDVKQRQGKK